MKILPLLLALGALVLAPALASAAVVLELKDQQVMAAGNITLNDLLQSSQGLSEDDLAVVLAPSPALGQSETWTREQIATLLPDSIKQQMPAWTGAKACAISRPADDAATRPRCASSSAPNSRANFPPTANSRCSSWTDSSRS